MRKRRPNLVPGTCKWILDQPAFQKWSAETRSILWLFGKPGSGKTYISQVSDHISTQKGRYNPRIEAYYEYANII
jgi:hypothetical protein